MDFLQWVRWHLLEEDSSDLIGQYGEYLTARKLKWSKLLGYDGLMLRNVYIPSENGETTETDLIYITKKGLFIIESKNYSGWIFGRERDRYWTQSLPDGTKKRFFNPVWQNRGHIRWLRAFLHDDVLPCFSLIVFSERCTLKKLDCHSETYAVIYRDELIPTIRSAWKRLPDIFDEAGVQMLYDRLVMLQDAGSAEKQKHIDDINRKYHAEEKAPLPEPKQEETSPAKPPERICPRCGAPMILRTAKKGDNAGKQFYGCSAFPKCRCILNLDE